MNKELVKITGEAKKVIFRNKENAYTILVMDTKNGEVIAVGEMPDLNESDSIEVTGEWKTTQKYGKQFVVKTVVVKDLTEKGIRKFLESSINGVGKVFANKIVDAFGMDTLNTISNHPEKLYKIKGVGKKRVDSLVESWDKVGKKNEIICFLQNHGLGTGRSEAIFHKYGNNTINIVKENPYLITEIKGIGFKIADGIATSIGEPIDSVHRCRAAIKYCTFELSKEGNCFSYRDDLVQKSVKILCFPKAKDICELDDCKFEHTTDHAAILLCTKEYKSFKKFIVKIPYDIVSDENKTSDFTMNEFIHYLKTNKINIPHCLDLCRNADHIIHKNHHELVSKSLDTEIREGSKKTSMGFQSGDLISTEDEAGKEIIYAKHILLQEQETAQHVVRISKGTPSWRSIDFDTAISASEKKKKIELSPHQKKAIINSLCSNFSIVTGGPGVGKTTVLNVLIDVALGSGCTVKMAAPTGKAAKRMSEATGAYSGGMLDESITLHRLLEYNGEKNRFMRNHLNPIKCDLLIVDEFSMSDLYLSWSLFRAVGPNTVVILVGDVDQLASVGAGNVLRDLIDSEVISVSRLDKIYRQAATSNIIVNAHRINHGLKPETTNDKDNDFFFINSETLGAIEREIVSLVTTRLPNKYGFDPLRDIQVLSPMYKNEAGVNSLNRKLQKALNPPANDKNEFKHFDVTFREGDKIIYTTNNYDIGVVNGDCGFISSINTKDEIIIIDFDGKEKLIVIDFNDADSLALSYVITIHKSQGSEYKCVLIPVTTSHYIMLERNLYYTAMTRGKELLVMVGQDRALEIAAKTIRSKKRNTMLKHRIKTVSLNYR